MRETLRIGTASKAQLPGWPAAGKTGTSQNFRDAWFVGYTSHLVAGVWLGNDDSSPTKKATGGGLPVEIWSRFMRSAHQNVPVASLLGVGTTSGPLAAIMPEGGLPRATLPASGAPVPPAPIGARPSAQQQQQQQNSNSLDGWFLDKLFGRR
jgi:penicillin-binding protein 1A